MREDWRLTSEGWRVKEGCLLTMADRRPEGRGGGLGTFDNR